ncbi:MAG: hypothetical protein HC906_15630 [Bacteroidales bacterium]|nr:hypothetical protein [Bacteroidales bacterium]
MKFFLPWRGTLGEDFRFTGYQGLASHGGVIGIIIGIYLFKRKTKMSYFWTLDRLAILAALTAFLIRSGNLMNSEIYGNPTGTENGFVYARDFTRLLQSQSNNEWIEEINYEKISEDTIKDNQKPIELNVVFSNRVKDEAQVNLFAQNTLRRALADTSYQNNITHPQPYNVQYTIEKEGRNFVLKANVFGVPKYPTQIYEALSYLIIFILLMWLYYRKGHLMRNGYYVSILLILVFTARFFIEFLKENQEAFEETMALNMGQILSIPFVLSGIILFWIVKRRILKF